MEQARRDDDGAGPLSESKLNRMNVGTNREPPTLALKAHSLLPASMAIYYQVSPGPALATILVLSPHCYILASITPKQNVDDKKQGAEALAALQKLSLDSKPAVTAD